MVMIYINFCLSEKGFASTSNFYKSLFIFGCAGSLLLCGLSVVVASGSYSLVAEHRLLVMASLVGEHGLCVLGLQKLPHMSSIVVTPGL